MYSTFEKFEPNPTVQRLGFLAMSKLYESELVFKNGSDEIIENHLNNGGNLILTPNHQSNADIPTVAALAHTKTFDKLRGNTIIPSQGRACLNGRLLGASFRICKPAPLFGPKILTTCTIPEY
jgi:hypothetical protein